MTTKKFLLSVVAVVGLSSCGGTSKNDHSVSVTINNTRPVSLGKNSIPLSAAEFTCFAINIVGDGIPSESPDTYPAASTLAAMLGADQSPCFYPGKTSAFLSVPAGATASATLEVPTGTNRIVQVLGIQGSDCLSTDKITDFARVYEVGRATQDIVVSGKISISPATPRRANCALPEPAPISLSGGIWKTGCISDGTLLGIAMNYQNAPFGSQSQKIKLDFSLPAPQITIVNYTDVLCGTSDGALIHSAVRYTLSSATVASTPLAASSDRYVTDFVIQNAEMAASSVSFAAFANVTECVAVISGTNIMGDAQGEIIDALTTWHGSSGVCGSPIIGDHRLDVVQATTSGLLFSYNVPGGAVPSTLLNATNSITNKEYVTIRAPR